MNLKIVQYSLALVLAIYIRLVRWTTRWSTDNVGIAETLQNTNKGFVVCTWHSRFLLTPAGWTKMKQFPHILISRSRDGNLVAYTAKIFGIGVVRGSRRAKFNDKDKRGAGALREMLNVIEGGDCIVMTPDGPRGPRMRLGEGPVRLAKLSGSPMIAYGLSTSHKILFNSWDRFMLPLPFGHGKIVFGEPVSVPSDADDAEIERLRLKFETILNEVSQQADLAVGNEPVMPEALA